MPRALETKTPSGPVRGQEQPAPALVEALYLEHAAFVWRVAARMGIDADEREDLVQDVFVVVHRNYAAYEGRGAITSWLFGIVRGLVANRRRRAGTAARHLRALRTPAAVDPVAGADAAETIATFTRSLAEGQRVVFELSEIEGMSGPEVAEALGINLNTVYTRLRAARRAFRTFAERELRDDARGGDGRD
ncbi:MAG: sigma-70 family RNA polymerase sigma factor [Myxococcota bacterium]